MAIDKDDTTAIRLLKVSRAAGLWGRLRASDLWNRGLERADLWAVLFLFAGAATFEPAALRWREEVKAGGIAERDYVANRDFLVHDEAATRVRQDEAAEKVLPVFDFAPGPTGEGQLARLFEAGRGLLGENPNFTAEQLAAQLIPDQPAPGALKVSAAQLAVLARHRFSPDLEDRLRGVLAQALRRGVVANKAQLLENRLRGVTLRNLGTGSEETHLDLFDHLGYPDEVRDYAADAVRDWAGFTAADRRQLTAFLVDNLAPNLSLNQSETLARRAAAAANAGQSLARLRKGQIIVRKGDEIDATDARSIAELRGELGSGRRWAPLFGSVLLLALAALVVWLEAGRFRVADLSRSRVFSESLLLLLLSLLGTKLAFVVVEALAASVDVAPFDSARSWAYAIPFASLAVLAALLVRRNVAVVLSLLLALLASRATPESETLWVVFYTLAGSLAAIFAWDRFQFRYRLVVARVGLVVGAVNVAMALIFAAVWWERSAAELGFDVLCGLAGGLLVAAVGSFAVPILEWLLGTATDIKLVELSNTNLPLLRRLAFEAPGTFQHSLMVANLAKEGCEAVGSDPVLAYAAGLYHDIGKVFRPDYFIENQRSGQNPHDQLAPSMSALILISHVKEGVDLAREHNLPRVLRDAVRQHHGTRLIKFFFDRAVKQRDPRRGEIAEAAEAAEADYRYPGPRPQSKAMGVLMLADAVEAASRTLAEPTPGVIREMIRAIVDDCLRDGQLDETDLTLSDLRVLSEAFGRMLVTIYHQRIDYPGFDFHSASKRERRAIRRVS
jgi:putative nucleotidyltransferase with HDIG domain